jgi:hypothetical protein
MSSLLELRLGEVQVATVGNVLDGVSLDYLYNYYRIYMNTVHFY